MTRMQLSDHEHKCLALIAARALTQGPSPSFRDLAREVGGHRTTAVRVMQKLVRRGIVKRIGYGVYRLPGNP